MAKPTKKPVKKAAPSKKPISEAKTKAKAKAAAPKNNVKAVKSTKAAAKTASKPATKSAVKAETKASKKTSPKTEAAKKVSNAVEKTAVPAKAAKKSKKEDLNDFDDNFDDEVAQYEDLKTKTPEQMEELRALLGEPDIEEVEIALRDSEGRLYCKMRDCDELSIADGYCRFHYLKLWKRIQLRKKILTDGKLEKYIEELTLRYPDKYIEMIREDLKSEKHFLAAIQELEIEDGNE
jgi:hypothetical protein